jgi:hypothetical protein
MFSKVDGALARIASEKEAVNEMRAKRLEEMANKTQMESDDSLESASALKPGCKAHARHMTIHMREKTDAALLRESAALWRDRDPEDALWELEYQRRYKRFDLCVGENFAGHWEWSATHCGLRYRQGTAETLRAAQAAAVAWVDAQEKG